jgi:hypothetical protein
MSSKDVEYDLVSTLIWKSWHQFLMKNRQMWKQWRTRLVRVLRLEELTCGQKRLRNLNYSSKDSRNYRHTQLDLMLLMCSSIGQNEFFLKNRYLNELSLKLYLTEISLNLYYLNLKSTP